MRFWGVEKTTRALLKASLTQAVKGRGRQSERERAAGKIVSPSDSGSGLEPSYTSHLVQPVAELEKYRDAA